MALAGLFVLGLTACEDFLDQEPDERVTVQNEEQVLKLLTSSYNTSNYGWTCEISSDNLIDLTAPHLPADVNSKQIKSYSVLNYYDRGDEEAFKFEQVHSNTGAESPRSIWNGCYASIARCNIAINTAVAESLRIFADELESCENFEETLHDIVKREIHEHKRIIFNGNGYDESWVYEAKKRGLLNLSSTPECLPYMLHEKNVVLYERHGVYTRTELEARYETAIEEYSKLINNGRHGFQAVPSGCQRIYRQAYGNRKPEKGIFRVY